MTAIVVAPLARIAEMAVRHRSREMISLIAKEQAFHRPAVISAERHLLLGMNDITFAGTGGLVAPQERMSGHYHFARHRIAAPLLIHCWMGVSRRPPRRLQPSPPFRKGRHAARPPTSTSPHATPNAADSDRR